VLAEHPGFVSLAPRARDRDIIEEPTDWASAHYTLTYLELSLYLLRTS
jgi:hypothetical protein